MLYAEIMTGEPGKNGGADQERERERERKRKRKRKREKVVINTRNTRTKKILLYVTYL